MFLVHQNIPVFFISKNTWLAQFISILYLNIFFLFCTLYAYILHFRKIKSALGWNIFQCDYRDNCLLISVPIPHIAWANSVCAKSVRKQWVLLKSQTFCSGPLCTAGLWCNIKMSSYQYRKSHYGDKTILRPSYLHNGISYTGKTTSYIESGPWFFPSSPIMHLWKSPCEHCPVFNAIHGQVAYLAILRMLKAVMLYFKLFRVE